VSSVEQLPSQLITQLLGLLTLQVLNESHWIPAFAGMTVNRFSLVGLRTPKHAERPVPAYRREEQLPHSLPHPNVIRNLLKRNPQLTAAALWHPRRLAIDDPASLMRGNEILDKRP
jgi:hypothetical protein